MGKKPFARTFPTEEELDSRADEPLGAFERKEHLVREKLVEVESVKLLREKVKQCYKREGVNHHQNCKELLTRGCTAEYRMVTDAQLVTEYLERLRHVGINRLNFLSK